LQTNQAVTETGGAVLFAQPEHVKAAVKRQMLLLDDWQLSALDKASGEAKVCLNTFLVLVLTSVDLLQSTCVSAMLCSGDLDPKGATEAIRTEEMFQQQRWGDIPHWHGIDAGLTRMNMSSCYFFSLTLRESKLQ
jgi:chaperone required for assembly of F1-ATPase